MMPQILFYFFAAVLIFSSIRVISSKNPVQSALFLILAFFSCGALWLLIEAEFLAIILVLVYVGAVMVLFLFVVMMIDINTEELHAEFVKYLPIGIVVGCLIVAEIIAVVLMNTDDIILKPVTHDADYSNTAMLGKLIYGEYLFAFEIAAAVLLVSLVAAVVLVLREPRKTKRQNISKQIKTQAKDRMYMVDLPRLKPKNGGEK